MEHIYPAFERGRIMKKELLWALRDYSYSALQLQYQNYPDGIISGCRIKVEKDEICISSGAIKCQDFIFLLTEEERVRYAPTRGHIGLKFRVVKKEALPDYTSYQSEFALDERLECESGEIEICRFKLKEGARLRTDYKDFYDIQTEYDTVNLAHATWTSAGQNTLSKEVTDFFAEKVLECEKAGEDDVRFAYLLLQGKEAVNYRILTDYITRKTGERGRKRFFSTEDAFRKLESILDGMRRGTEIYKTGGMGTERRMIIWD